MNGQFSPADFTQEIAELTYKSLIEPEKLGEEERRQIDDHRRRMSVSVKKMIVKNKAKKRVGFETAKKIDQQRFISSFKSFLFFCRSFQDEIYASTLLLAGQQPGSGGRSMTNAFNDQTLSV